MKILIEFQQQEYVMKFLMGLKDSYSNIRGQILLSDPLPPINKVFSLILQEEKQREIASAILPTPDSLAFLSRSSNSGSGVVPRYGHNAGGNQFVKKERPLCSHCGVVGHTVDKCFKLHGYPPRYKNPKAKAYANHVTSDFAIDNTTFTTDTPPFTFTQAQYQQLLSLMQPRNTPDTQPQSFPQSSALQVTSQTSLEPIPNMTGTTFCLSSTSHSQINWIIDTGATDHMVHSQSSLSHVVSTISSTVKLPNGHSAAVTHIGHVQISPTLTLNVLCVSSFDFNLILVSQLTREINCCVFFFPGFVTSKTSASGR